jgi:hypothetical protein
MKLWDWLDEITVKKSPPSKFSDEDWESWNSYMVHRFISMGQKNIEIANIAQRMHPTDKLLKLIASYFECGFSEADEYIDTLGMDKIKDILKSMGQEKKSITKLIKL